MRSASKTQLLLTTRTTADTRTVVAAAKVVVKATEKEMGSLEKASPEKVTVNLVRRETPARVTRSGATLGTEKAIAGIEVPALTF